MFKLILSHPWWTLFLAVGFAGVTNELYLWFHPSRRASNHWRGEIAFTARDPGDTKGLRR